MSWINFPQLCYTPHLLSSSLKLSLSRQLGYRDTVVMIEQQRPRLALWLPKRRLRYFSDVHKKWCKIVFAVKKIPQNRAKVAENLTGWDVSLFQSHDARDESRYSHSQSVHTLWLACATENPRTGLALFGGVAESLRNTWPRTWL